MTNHSAPLQKLQFETASEHYTSKVPIVCPEDLAGPLHAGLVGHQFDTVDEIVVCAATGRLEGLVNIEDLLAASDHTPLTALMD